MGTSPAIQKTKTRKLQKRKHQKYQKSQRHRQIQPKSSLHHWAQPVEQRRLPWAGITTGHAPAGQLLTSEQMLEEAGLNWDVDVRSLYQQMNDGQFREHPWAREVYRTDTETPLGVVKTRYKLITNRQMFEFGDKIVEDGAGHWAEAGTQGDGRRVFMTMKLNDDFNIAGDGYDVYIFFAGQPRRYRISPVHQPSRSGWSAPTRHSL